MSSSIPAVLLIADGIGTNRGLSSINLELASRLVSTSKDHPVDVFCTTIGDEPLSDSPNSDGIRVLPVQKLETFKILKRIDEAKARSQIQIVIGHAHVTGEIAQEIAKELGAKFVLMHHTAPGLYDPRKSDWDPARTDSKIVDLSRLSTAADMLLCVGPLIYSRWCGEFDEDEKPIFQYQPLGGEDFVRLPARKPRATALPVVRYVGAVNNSELETKGIARILAVVKEVRRELNTEIELSIIGAPSDNERTLLRSEIWTTVAGMQPRAEVAEAMRKSSVVVMPSLLEPFGVTGLEALLAGVPTLVTADSGLAMWLKEFLQSNLYDACVASEHQWKSKLVSILSNASAALDAASKIREKLAAARSEIIKNVPEWMVALRCAPCYCFLRFLNLWWCICASNATPTSCSRCCRCSCRRSSRHRPCATSPVFDDVVV
jgi:glycosyltransferase involved in cell wall biosynthesis